MNLIIFDCDGVLIDSETISSRIEAELLQELGIEVTPAELERRFVGRTIKSMLETLAVEHATALAEGVEDLIKARVLQAFRTELQAIPGVHALLDDLDTQPVARCVASSSDYDRLELSLGVTGLYPRFAPDVFSAESVSEGKPAPDLFLFAAEKMGAAPADCLVIEDSENGVRAAVAAGMPVIGFIGAGHSPPGAAGTLLALGAEQVVEEMNVLRGLVATRQRR